MPLLPGDDLWPRVKAIFDAVKDLPLSARPAAVEAAARGNLPLQREVESLLAFDVDDDGFLEQPPVVLLGDQPELPDRMVGQTIGPYRITGLVGQGGMGTVYRAVRADAAYEKTVAVKLISRGTTPGGVEQFKQERQALAALDHPHIARLLDGGETDEGRPYFIMELVEGVPLDAFCDARRLSIDERLTLFRSVCGAVQFAHEHLIVHRDLKPDNILVLDDGTPKLLDFGIARLLHETGGQSGTGEPAGAGPMTPEFASPEQVTGGAVTTATDVYSLGVVLYRLLSGRRPYHVGGTGATSFARMVSWTAPLPPSTASAEAGVAARSSVSSLGAVCAARRTTPRALRRRLAGDLDAIVERAMQKKPEDRYRSVEQLSADIQRHLDGLPIVAGPDRVSYRAGKFIARHRVGMAAAALAAVALVAGVASIAWQVRVATRERARAERRLNDVRQLANSFMFEIHDAIVNVPGTTAARALMVGRALTYLDSLAAESGGDASLQRELADGYVKVGDAQGHPTSANIGDSAGATLSYDKAIAIGRGLVTARRDDREAQRILARAYRQQADLFAWTGDVPGGVARTRMSRDMYDALARGAATGSEDGFQAAVAEIKLGDLLGNANFPNAGDAPHAVEAYRRALPMLVSMEQMAPGDERVNRYLGIVRERLGQMAESAGDFLERSPSTRSRSAFEPSSRPLARSTTISSAIPPSRTRRSETCCARPATLLAP